MLENLREKRAKRQAKARQVLVRSCEKRAKLVKNEFAGWLIDQGVYAKQNMNDIARCMLYGAEGLCGPWIKGFDEKGKKPLREALRMLSRKRIEGVARSVNNQIKQAKRMLRVKRNCRKMGFRINMKVDKNQGHLKDDGVKIPRKKSGNFFPVDVEEETVEP